MVPIIIFVIAVLVIAFVVGGIIWAAREDMKDEKNKKH